MQFLRATPLPVFPPTRLSMASISLSPSPLGVGITRCLENSGTPRLRKVSRLSSDPDLSGNSRVALCGLITDGSQGVYQVVATLFEMLYSNRRINWPWFY